MKEKRIDLKSTMSLPKKKDLVSNVALKDIDKSVNRLHETEVIRLSLDVSPDLYKRLKLRQIELGEKTTRGYLLSLIERDLGV